MKIHVVHTGGTFASVLTKAGIVTLGASAPRVGELLENGAARTLAPDFVADTFIESAPFTVHSENLTPARWRELIAHLNGLDFSRADGLILTHGTDTLAYTACLLARLTRELPFPVLLVAANRPLADPESNGRINLAAAVRLIHERIPPGVYVPYKNRSGTVYIHAGAEILQCPSLSDDFFSLRYGDDAGLPLGELRPTGTRFFRAPPRAASDESVIPRGIAPAPRIRSLGDFGGELARVLTIVPHPGADASCYVPDGCDALLTEPYHSATLPVAFARELAARCAAAAPPVPIFLAPYPKEARGALYESTAAILECGLIPLCGLTREMAYVRLLLELPTRAV